MAKLKNKVAVVAGASKGIGASIAKHLAAEGARVVVNHASSAAAADQVVNEIRAAGGEAVAVQADVSQPAQVKALFDATGKAFGAADVLVNNAGVRWVAVCVSKRWAVHRAMARRVDGWARAGVPAEGGLMARRRRCPSVG